MIPIAPVAAGIGDFIGILIFVLFIVISVVGQIAAKWRESQEQAQKRQAQRPQPRPAAAQPRRAGGPAPRGAARPRAGAGQDPLKDEIGEFLRRAAERRGAAPAQPASGRPGPPPAPSRQSRPIQRRPAPPVEEPIDVELVEAAPAQDRAPAKPAPQPGDTAKRALEAVGHGIEQADERMIEHLHKVFDHDVGTLQHVQPGVQVQSPLPQTTAAGLAAMVSDPTRLRQAILLNEIFQRPEHRWL